MLMRNLLLLRSSLMVTQTSPRWPEMESVLNPPWAKADLAVMIQGLTHTGDGFSVDVHCGAQDRMAGLNKTQLFVGSPSDGWENTATTSTVFETRPGGVRKDSLGFYQNVRTQCKAGRLREALHIMNQGGVCLDSYTYLCILQECIKMNRLAEGKQVHMHIIKSGFNPNIFLLNTLVNMYAKCGSLVDARKVFDNMPKRDVFTWTIMITGYAKCGCSSEAFNVYEQMQREGVMPNTVTFICILKACARVGALDKGKEVHAHIVEAQIVSYINLENTLVDMYAKCGSMRDAHKVFDNMAKQDVVSWNAMIGGYAQHGCGLEALKMYEEMQWKGVTPNAVTISTTLNACASLGALEKGKAVHADSIKAGIVPDVILETALACMYAKCGSMKDSRKVFDSMAKRDEISWNTMIAGYAQHGCGSEALNIYEQMQREGVTPNRVTFICVLLACASQGALEKGKEVHAAIRKAGIASCVDLETALVDMYAKCGSMMDALEVFNSMSKRNVVSWSAMISGYAQNGRAGEALQLFLKMKEEGIKPNAITFTSVLCACSHEGLVDEGLHYFDSISRDHGLTPTVEHFGCIVDLLGRAGRLDEAEDFIRKLPIEADAGVLGAFLSACRFHGNVELAEWAAKCLLKLDPQHAPT